MPQRLAQRQVGIFVGMGTTDYGDLQAALGAMGADAYNGTGGSHAAAAGRGHFSWVSRSKVRGSHFAATIR